MNKLLLNLIGCLFTATTFAQTTPTWNVTSGSPLTWTYSFAGGPVPSGVNGGSNIYTAPGSGTNSLVSTPGTRDFLPEPPSGGAAFRVGSGTPVVTLVGNGTTDELQFQASGTAAIGKLGFMNAGGMTAITMVNFKVKFVSEVAEWVAAVGYHDGANYGGGVFATTSNFTATTFSRDLVFSSFRWTNNGAGGVKVEHGVQTASGNSSLPTFSIVQVGGQDLNFAINTEYSLRFICNNSTTDQFYSFNGQVYAVPAGKLHFWVDNNQATVSSAPDLAGSFLASGTEAEAINSFMIQGRMNPAATPAGTLSISGINMQSAASTMPVSFASFSGKATNNGVVLNWQTASETNNSHFDVLRFSDANTTPVKIGEVAGKGNSSSLVSYSFTDNNPVTGVNYYQLKQVDKDGKSSLSQVVDVKAGLSSSSFVVYQSADKKSVASIKSEENTIAHLSLSDLNGRTFNKIEYRLSKGDNLITLSETALTPGVYLGTLNLNGVKVTRKFIVNP